MGTYECSRCHNLSDLEFISTQQWFTLFWIPVFPISKKQEFMKCPICHQAYEVPK
ncbi:zinc-ribbon domain-containing protein [Leptotrichia hofstadii]|uniref:zinc-ribbon domain-containing protein n=1 Tax=Leptotrichia hofstadii TaxID=157688 RepID=UPI001E63EEF7|nr:zinc ribbon domain-containing protein [Leptotrichia hofstadii]